MKKIQVIDKLKNWNLGLKKGTVSIEEYSPLWKEAFDFLKDEISSVLQDGSELYHIGSTAIPACSAKPILDILLVHKEDSNFGKDCKALSEIGFTDKGDYGIHGRNFFTFYDDENIFDYIHIHAFSKGHPSICELKDFVKVLSNHKGSIIEYIKLKQKLIESGVSRKEYPKAKTDFIRKYIPSSKIKRGLELHFALVKKEQYQKLVDYLQQDYISKWIHGAGLESTLNDLKLSFLDKSPAKYWFAYDHGRPFAFLITCDVDQTEEAYHKVIFSGKKALSLDIFICEPEYLGKGYAGELMNTFLKAHFKKYTDVIIDPECTNKRAVHVYEKVGFKKVDKFLAPWHPVPHFLMHKVI